jgi:signal transduction histidine kinase
VLTSVWHDGARQSIIVTLLEVAAEAEALNRPVRLLQYLSHEMRASLLMIEESLRSLAGRPPAERDLEAPAATLAFLAQESARLRRLLADASKFHRTLRELPEIEMEAIDLVSVVKDSVSGITALAVPQGVEVAYRGPSLAPKVWGHHDKLLQVLYNLLLNALKFTPRCGGVWVELSIGDREIVTTVADTGRGIAAGELAEIMAQAQRAELFLPQKGKRVGLGLSIAHQIVRAHRGRLTAESTPGLGSRFSFTLPLWAERGQAQHPLAEGSAAR